MLFEPPQCPPASSATHWPLKLLLPGRAGAAKPNPWCKGCLSVLNKNWLWQSEGHLLAPLCQLDRGTALLTLELQQRDRVLFLGKANRGSTIRPMCRRPRKRTLTRSPTARTSFWGWCRETTPPGPALSHTCGACQFVNHRGRIRSFLANPNSFLE